MGLSINPNIHPLFMTAAHYPLELLANSKISVYPTSDSVEHGWNPDDGLVTEKLLPIWIGWANVTPNTDWRARNSEWAGVVTGVHAYRVQLLHIDKNEAMNKHAWGDPGMRVSFAEGMRVVIDESPADHRQDGLKLVVRNAVFDTLPWQPTLLCDVETGGTARGEN